MIPQHPSDHALALWPTLQSEFGLKMYMRGRRMVHELGIYPEHLVWDADEVLWDWCMGGKLALLSLPHTVRHRDIGHRELFQLKPGVLEMIQGMCDQAAEQGLDARMRLWTNGYAWRLWAISRHVPGFAGLFGLLTEDGPDVFEHSDVIFCRHDYARAIEPLLDRTRRMQWLEQQSWRTRDVISTHLERDPFQSAFKIPELAGLVGKRGFEHAQIMIDDHFSIVKHFARTGRKGIEVTAHPVKDVSSKLPNVTWELREDVFDPMITAVAEKIAQAIESLGYAEDGKVLTVDSGVRPYGFEPVRFAIDIPNERISGQWVEPMEALKDRHLSRRQKIQRSAGLISRRLRRRLKP